LNWVCSWSDEQTDSTLWKGHLPTPPKKTFLSHPLSFETIQFLKMIPLDGPLACVPGVGQWLYPIILLFRPWRAPSCIFFLAGWKRTWIPMMLVLFFFLLFWRSRLDDYFLDNGYKFYWGWNPIQNIF
jgi:hypothetical protein